MNNLKRNLLFAAFVILLACGAAGCTNVRNILNGPVPTKTPSPTPTRSASLWVSATPTYKPTATPTMTLDEALNKAEQEVRDKYGNPTPTPTKGSLRNTPTPTRKAGATPTPGAGTKATPTPTQGASTPTPTNTPKPAQTNAPAPTNTPTNTPTKAPTNTPTPKPVPSGAPNAAFLLNKLYETYPGYMSTTSFMMDVRQIKSDGDVKNLYYTKYTNEENYDNINHSTNDIWVTTLSGDTFLSEEVYMVFNSGDITTYSNNSDQETLWTKKKLSKNAAATGVSIIPRSGNVAILNPTITNADPSVGYELTMDCAVEFTEILSTLTKGSYTRKFNKTFKATAIFDYETLTPILFLSEAENINVSSDLVLNYFQYRVDNIMENPSAIEVPDDVIRKAK